MKRAPRIAVVVAVALVGAIAPTSLRVAGAQPAPGSGSSTPTNNTPTNDAPTNTPPTNTPPTNTPPTSSPTEPPMGSATRTTTNPGTTTPANPADRVVIIPAKPAKKSADDDGEPRLSLPSEADRAAWTRSGFRVELGLAYGRLVGIHGPPDGRLLGPVIRIGLRLDKDWSVLASFQYLQAKTAGQLNGLRFAGTVDPTWHVTRNFALAVGFGFGGIVEGRTGRADIDPLPSTLETSYTFPDARTPIPSCSGVGAATLARAEYSYVLGPRASTSLALEGVGQWTACVQDTNRLEPDSGQAIVRRQFWAHSGLSLTWGVTWR